MRLIDKLLDIFFEPKEDAVKKKNLSPSKPLPDSVPQCVKKVVYHEPRASEEEISAEEMAAIRESVMNGSTLEELGFERVGMPPDDGDEESDELSPFDDNQGSDGCMTVSASRLSDYGSVDVRKAFDHLFMKPNYQGLDGPQSKAMDNITRIVSQVDHSADLRDDSEEGGQ